MCKRIHQNNIQESWSSFFMRSAAQAVGTTVGVVAGAKASLELGKYLPWRYTATTDAAIQKSMLFIPNAAVADVLITMAGYAIPGAVVGGVAGYIVTNEVAQRILHMMAKQG